MNNNRKFCLQTAAIALASLMPRLTEHADYAGEATDAQVAEIKFDFTIAKGVQVELEEGKGIEVLYLVYDCESEGDELWWLTFKQYVTLQVRLDAEELEFNAVHNKVN